MTIIFGYFQYMSQMYLITSTIPLIVSACFYIVLNFFVIRSSKTNPEEKERPELLYYIGVIGIIFVLIRFALPVYSMTSPPSGLDILLELIYAISYGLVLSLPSLITYGIFMFKYGKANEQRFKSYLKFSGILWIISTSITTIMLGGCLVSILFLFLPYSYVIWYTLTLLISITGLINFVAWILLIVHSVKNNDKNLLISGILAIAAFGAAYLYDIFLLPILYNIIL
jgi:hypothetical protein